MLEFIQMIKQKIHKLGFLLLYKASFKQFSRKSTICFPFTINGAKYISIENNVYIKEGAWIMALNNNKVEPNIRIGTGTYIGRFTHIVSTRKIEIGQNALLSDKVYISDNLHDYKDISKPIKEQQVIFKNSVSVGDNTWLGENVCVIGASVGKHCVIGANSVVLSNVPDYSIAVGSPARVIKQYCHKTKQWEKV